jgi:hypothetical protein
VLSEVEAGGHDERESSKMETASPGGVDIAIRGIDVDVARLLSGLQPEEIAFWSGAGISLSPPTNLKNGVDLTRFVLNWAFDDDPLSVLCGPIVHESPLQRDASKGLYGMLDIGRQTRQHGVEYRWIPRLEVILGVASDPWAHGPVAIEAAIAEMRVAAPNRAHRFFHEHCRRGGSHVTANFDRCIERSGTEDVSDRVVHFHGSVDDPAASLGATFRSIERGLTTGMKNRILGVAQSARCVVIVGYSGLDVFDIAPWFADLAQTETLPLSGVRVVWVEYASGSPVLANEVEAPGVVPGSLGEFLAEESVPWDVRQRLDLSRAGAEVVLLRGNPEVLYEYLAAEWQTNVTADEVAPGPDAIRLDSNPLFEASGDSRKRATILLWRSLGWNAAAVAAMREQPALVDPAVLAEAEADLEWQRGNYRRAARIWARVRPMDSPQQRVAWDERQIACRWAAGRFLSALARCRVALWRAERAGIVPTELVELWGRIIQHMERTPDLRWIAGRQRRAALAALKNLLPNPNTGVHSRIRLESVRNALLGQHSDGGNFSARAQFLESESLSSVLNYRHARLRRLPSPSSDRFADQQRWFRVLRLEGDAHRVAFLPGAAGALGFGSCWSAAWGCQFGLVHRLRLLSASAIRIARTRWIRAWANTD